MHADELATPSATPPTRSLRTRLGIASGVIAFAHTLVACFCVSGLLDRFADPAFSPELAGHSPFFDVPLGVLFAMISALLASIWMHTFVPRGRGLVRTIVVMSAHVVTALAGMLLVKLGGGWVADVCVSALVLDVVAWIYTSTLRETLDARSAGAQPSNNPPRDARASSRS